MFYLFYTNYCLLFTLLSYYDVIRLKDILDYHHTQSFILLVIFSIYFIFILTRVK